MLASAVPFHVAWLSERLYRVVGEQGPYGLEVRLAGWDRALTRAWEGLISDSAAVVTWCADYDRSRGDEILVVTFADTRRIVGRHGQGHFGVSYPVDLLLADDDPVTAMRSAVLVVLDRHVDRSGLAVPLLSSIVGSD